MKIYYIDRIEGNVIVCQSEEGSMLEISADLLSDAKEGDCIVYDGSTYTIDSERTEKRKEETDSLLNSMFR